MIAAGWGQPANPALEPHGRIRLARSLAKFECGIDVRAGGEFQTHLQCVLPVTRIGGDERGPQRTAHAALEALAEIGLNALLDDGLISLTGEENEICLTEDYRRDTSTPTDSSMRNATSTIFRPGMEGLPCPSIGRIDPGRHLSDWRQHLATHRNR